jgi:hypothetical protein
MRKRQRYVEKLHPKPSTSLALAGLFACVLFASSNDVAAQVHPVRSATIAPPFQPAIRNADKNEATYLVFFAFGKATLTDQAR